MKPGDPVLVRVGRDRHFAAGRALTIDLAADAVTVVLARDGRLVRRSLKRVRSYDPRLLPRRVAGPTLHRPD